MQQELLHAKQEQARISKSSYATSSEKGKVQHFIISSPSFSLFEGIACFFCI